MIPILLNHDADDVLGFITFGRDKLEVEFKAPITEDDFFDLFPGAGIVLKDYKIEYDIIKFTKCEILEVSLVPR